MTFISQSCIARQIADTVYYTSNSFILQMLELLETPIFPYLRERAHALYMMSKSHVQEVSPSLSAIEPKPEAIKGSETSASPFPFVWVPSKWLDVY